MNQLQEGRRERPHAGKISIVIPHYDDVENLAVCVYAVLRQGANEVIILDDGSDQPPKVDQPPFNDARVLIVYNQDREGAATRRNQGLLIANNEKLGFIDSDAIPTYGWLVYGLMGLDTYDVLGGIVRKYYTGPHPRVAERYSKLFQDPSKGGKMAISGNLFAKKSALQRAGGWTRTPFVSEDIDIYQKCKAKGLKAEIHPYLVVLHPAFTAKEKLRRIKRSAQRVRANKGGLRYVVSRSLPWMEEVRKVRKAAATKKEATQYIMWHVAQRIAFGWYWITAQNTEEPTW